MIGYYDTGYAFSAAIDMECVVFELLAIDIATSDVSPYPAPRYPAVGQALFVPPQSC
jgi:hypothetical protein